MQIKKKWEKQFYVFFDFRLRSLRPPAFSPSFSNFWKSSRMPTMAALRFSSSDTKATPVFLVIACVLATRPVGVSVELGARRFRTVLVTRLSFAFLF